MLFSHFVEIGANVPCLAYLLIGLMCSFPAFLLYTASAVAVALVLILYCAPRFGQTNIMVYIGICSIIGSLTVSYSGPIAYCSLTLWRLEWSGLGRS
jgi:hypothetical protein